METQGKTPADFRARIARERALLYRLAADVGVWPGRLGQMLNERIPMPAEVAERLTTALDDMPEHVGDLREISLRKQQEA